MVESPPLIPCARCLSFYATSLFHPTPCFHGYNSQILIKPLWGVLWLPQWSGCIQTKYPLVQPPIQKSSGIPTKARDHLCLADL